MSGSVHVDPIEPSDYSEFQRLMVQRAQRRALDGRRPRPSSADRTLDWLVVISALVAFGLSAGLIALRLSS